MIILITEIKITTQWINAALANCDSPPCSSSMVMVLIPASWDLERKKNTGYKGFGLRFCAKYNQRFELEPEQALWLEMGMNCFTVVRFNNWFMAE